MTFRNFDPYPVAQPFSAVKFSQLGTQPTGFNTYDRVDTRIERLVFPKDLNAQGEFFEPFSLTLQFGFDDET